MEGRRRALLWLAILAVALALPASASAAGLKAIWGPTKMPDGSSAFPVYDDLGVDVFQLQVDWAGVARTRPANPANPSDPAYRWGSTVDYAIQEANAHGMSVALMVKGTPWWSVAGALQGADVRTQVPTSVQDYADFLTAVSARYPSVHRWMIWGETNRLAVWSSGPAAYANLLDAAYGALKPLPGDPDVVVGGMTFTYGETPARDWVAGMVRSNGARPRLDEYGHNPFTRRCPDIGSGPNYLKDGARDISDVDTLATETKAAFGASTKLWLSEFTISSDRANRALTFFLSRADQADWLTKAFAIAGSVPYVSGLGWFNLADEPVTDPLGLTTGLMTYEGEHKPAYAAYRDAKLDGSMPVVSCYAPADPPSPPAPPAPPADRSPPALTVTGKPRIALKALLRSGYSATVRCDESCTVDAALQLSPKEARRRGLASGADVGRARVLLAAGAGRTVTVRLTRKAARKLRGARGLTLTLRVTARDAAGNSTVRTLKLRPR
jgi:polysaccharide biosynthesis protein PslG